MGQQSPHRFYVHCALIRGDYGVNAGNTLSEIPLVGMHNADKVHCTVTHDSIFPKNSKTHLHATTRL